MKGQTYSKGTDVTLQNVSGTDEYLTVDTTKIVPFEVDAIDKVQNKWDMAMKFAGDAQRVLNNFLDQAVLSEVSNASSSVYDLDVGGSGATTAIPLTVSNVPSVFTSAGMKLDALDMPQVGRFAVIGPHFLQTLRLQIQGKDTGAADMIAINGKVMDRFGFELFYSNNLPFSATWTPADNPTNGGYITVNGVLFTFVDTIGTTAGNVHIGSTTADTLDNLVYAINGSGGTVGTDYVEISSSNRHKMNKANLVATDGTTAVTLAGFGDIGTSTSVAGDAWTVQLQHVLCGVKGASDLVVQRTPNVEFHQPELRLGKIVMPWMLYGKKTFNNMKDALVDVVLDASGYR
ncbi:MAG: hypothetical protein M0R06_06945 [Sphaerochaeta sp.]|nr:hypothetical protein [Sphaerochaeta sp.]